MSAFARLQGRYATVEVIPGNAVAVRTFAVRHSRAVLHKLRHCPDPTNPPRQNAHKNDSKSIRKSIEMGRRSAQLGVPMMNSPGLTSTSRSRNCIFIVPLITMKSSSSSSWWLRWKKRSAIHHENGRRAGWDQQRSGSRGRPEV